MKTKNSVVGVIGMFVLCVTVLHLTLNAGETKADDIAGIWLVEEAGAPLEKIEIYKSGNLYSGTIVWINDADTTDGPAVDKNNENKKLRDRPLVGLEILKNYRFDGKDSWQDGELYAHRKGKTVSPRLTLVDHDHLKVVVKFLFVKKSFIWKRVSTEQLNWSH